MTIPRRNLLTGSLAGLGAALVGCSATPRGTRGAAASSVSTPSPAAAGEVFTVSRALDRHNASR
ncbi:MAG: hypothetical protein ACRDRN_04590 [Sciscionella sp.]